MSGVFACGLHTSASSSCHEIDFLLLMCFARDVAHAYLCNVSALDCGFLPLTRSPALTFTMPQPNRKCCTMSYSSRYVLSLANFYSASEYLGVLLSVFAADLVITHTLHRVYSESVGADRHVHHRRSRSRSQGGGGVCEAAERN